MLLTSGHLVPTNTDKLLHCLSTSIFILLLSNINLIYDYYCVLSVTEKPPIIST